MSDDSEFPTADGATVASAVSEAEIEICKRLDRIIELLEVQAAATSPAAAAAAAAAARPSENT